MANDKIKIGDYQVLADEIIGHEDISEIGGGTVRGAIAEIGKKVIKVVNTKEDFDGLEDKSGTIIVKNEDYVLSANEISYGDGSVKNAIDSVKQSIPTVPTVDATLNKNSTNPISNKVVAEKFGGIETEISTVKEHLQQVSYDSNAGGENIWNEQWEQGSISQTNGTPNTTIQANTYRSASFCPCKPSTVYFLTKGFNVYWYDENKNFLSYVEKTTSTTTTSHANAKFFKIDNRNEGTYGNDVALIEGTSGEYKPYIKSVKQLTEEVVGINSSLRDVEFLGWEVPSECPVQNYVDAQGNFHQKVGRIDLSTLAFADDDTTSKTFFTTNIRDSKLNDMKLKSVCYCSKYSFTDENYTYVRTNDKTFTTNYSDYTNQCKFLLFRDTSYTDATAFKNAMKNVYLYYELATEKVIKCGNEAVQTLNNNLAYIDLSNALTLQTGVSKSTAYAENGIVYLRLVLDKSVAVTGDNILGTILSKYAPRGAVNGFFSPNTGADVSKCSGVLVRDNGQIQCSLSSTLTANGNIILMYPLKTS